MTQRVAVEIGRLVVTGFGRAEGERVAQAFALELERLCAGGVAPGGSRLAEGIRAEPIRIGGDPERIGIAAAQSTHRSLGE